MVPPLSVHKICVIFFFVYVELSQGQWAWVGGSSDTNTSGSYGNRNQYSTTNLPPSREKSASFYNQSTKRFWMFGGVTAGSGTEAYLNDLWAYDGSRWAWLSGSNSVNSIGTYGTVGQGTSSTVPSARKGAMSWTKIVGSTTTLYLYGGYGVDSTGTVGYLSDFWSWDGNQWIWISGSSSANVYGTYKTKGGVSGNIPGARTEAGTFIDSNNRLWLHGGTGYAASTFGYLNDMWYWNGVNWIWIFGSNASNQVGRYNTKGTASTSSIPGSRSGAATSYNKDSCTYYVFGGEGYTQNAAGLLSDLWMFSCTNNMWTWIAGPTDKDQSGNWGSLGATSASNVPSSRQNSLLFERNGALLLFGGTFNQAYFNDLWTYQTSTGQWTWVGGAKTSNQRGSYRSSTPSSLNTVGSRKATVGYWDSTDTLTIFGGFGFGGNGGTEGYLMDTWSLNDPTVVAQQTTNPTTGSATTGPATTGPATTGSATTGPATTGPVVPVTTGSATTGPVTTGPATTGSSTTGLVTTGSATTGSPTVPSTTGSVTETTTGSSPSTSEGATTETSTGHISAGGSTTTNDGEGTPNTTSVNPLPSTSESNPGSQTDSESDSGGIAASLLSPMWLGIFAGILVVLIIAVILLILFIRKRKLSKWLKDHRNLQQQPPLDIEKNISMKTMGTSAPIATTTSVAPQSPLSAMKKQMEQLSPRSQRNRSYTPIRSESGISLMTSSFNSASRNPSSASLGIDRNSSFGSINRSLTSTSSRPNNNIYANPASIIGKNNSFNSFVTTTSSSGPLNYFFSPQNDPRKTVDKFAVPYSELKFTRKIGKGSFGKVYLGEWEKMTVAIKVCSQMDPDNIMEFLAEAKLMMSIRPHPHVLQILGISTGGPNPAMILEFCSKASLDKLVYSEKPLDEITSFKIINGVALGMLHLHKNNIVHRDLASRNILLSSDLTPKIADFGLSRFYDLNNDVQVTHSNALPLRWMAPESLRDRSYSFATDVWSFGILVSEVLNREPPHKNLDMIQAAFRIRDEGLTPKLREGLPYDIVDILEQCWSMDPEQRPSFDMICEELRNCQWTKMIEQEECFSTVHSPQENYL